MKTLITLGSLLVLFSTAASHGATSAAATRKPSHVTTNSATLLGRVLPGPTATDVHFKWGLTTNLGNSTALQSLSAGRRAVLVQSPISGLNPLTTYFCRVVASNTNGVALGRIVEFSTRGLPPQHPDPAQVEEVGEGLVRFSSHVRPFPGPQPSNSVARISWQWGLTTNYGRTTPSVPVLQNAVGTNVVYVEASRDTTGLKPFVMYHFRGVVVNEWGTGYGPDSTFVLTQATPAVTLREKNVGPFHVTLQGRARAYAGTTGSWYFQYGPNLTDAQTTPQPLTRPGNRAVVVAISNLWEQTTYRYRLVVEVNGVPYPGDERSFVTGPAPNPPVVQTLFATNITDTTVVLLGRVTPNSVSGPSLYSFQYGPPEDVGHVPFPGQDPYGQTTPNQSGPVGFSPTDVPATLANLTPNTTYHFRFKFYKAITGEIFYGADQTFTTLHSVSVVTLPATVTNGAVTLRAFAKASGTSAPIRFEWGAATNYGVTTATQVLAAGTNFTLLTMNIGPLPPGEYHFRAVGTSAETFGVGADQPFFVRSNTNEFFLTECSEEALRQAISSNRTVRFASDCQIQLNAPVTITSETVLDATGYNVVLSGSGSNRLFEVRPGASLSLFHLTIADGRLAGTNGVILVTPHGQSVAGGGILVSNAQLTAVVCTFTNCAVQGGTGADANDPLFGVGQGGAARGAAVAAQNSLLNFSSCVFVNNKAIAGRSGLTSIFPQLLRTKATASGGALDVAGGVSVIEDCQFLGNQATSHGGAVCLQGSAQSSRLLDSQFLTNSASASGGAVALLGGAMDLSGSALNGNTASDFSAGTYTTSTAGGAVVVSGGVAKITACEFGGNRCSGADGYPLPPTMRGMSGTSGSGGALAGLGGVTAVVGSAFHGNAATGGDGTIGNGFFLGAPASALGGALFASAEMNVTNCTFALNTARAGSLIFGGTNTGHSTGGAIAQHGSQLVLESCTIASNRVSDARGDSSFGGGLYFVSSSTGFVHNSVFSFNSAHSQLSNNLSGGVVIDLGGNISSDSTPAWSTVNSLNNVDALLLPLADNGGPTPTMALGAGSPAFNWAAGNFPPTDQRGVARPAGAGADSGAWEGSVLVPSFRRSR
jgi:hypothetical protein